ncbi:MAG TPA: hydantoinase/oxoprolinase family protein [Tepidisphaeraceae bacterium]|jgi:N-methylhydantoinase A
MHALSGEQTGQLIGVDVGGTFTDLVALDRLTGALKVVKVPSSPPEFHRAVIDAVGRALDASGKGRVAAGVSLIHGSTVATNALLQRAGSPIAFVTTEGFRDMLLIGRQNRPRLYALKVERPRPITAEENWFTVPERMGASGKIIQALSPESIHQLIEQLRARQLQHVAVCLLFSFVNPVHEQRLGKALGDAGFTVTLSSDLLPEFREYERASTTAINASLRPTVESYLRELSHGLPEAVKELRIVQSAGGTLTVEQASREAAKLVLSGPAGGVSGAAFVAKAAGATDIITYDMGGTSTDVALVLNGEPTWTTQSNIDGLPLALAMYDIHTVGAGGGSIAHLDPGGALRVGPRSAGAIPGPASYGRGGTEPTVTDANLILGRIVPDQFLGGAMKVDAALAEKAIEPLARNMNKSLIEAALGIITIAEANMTSALRAVTARRGHDPRNFTLVSFGGAGGLHACALADALQIPRVLIPPYSGVLSALGMIVAPPQADVSRTVVNQAATLSDHDLEAEYASLSGTCAMDDADTASTHYFADVRFKGQSHEIKIEVHELAIADISRRFYTAYRQLYGRPPRNRPIEIVTLRLRKIGRAAQVQLPEMKPQAPAYGHVRITRIIDARGETVQAGVLRRAELLTIGPTPGPVILIDPEATTFVPAGWLAQAESSGIVRLSRLQKV